MAITLASTTSVQDKTTRTSWSAILATTFAIGDLLVLACAADNGDLVNGTNSIGSPTTTGVTWTQRILQLASVGLIGQDGLSLKVWTGVVTTGGTLITTTIAFSPSTIAKTAIMMRFTSPNTVQYKASSAVNNSTSTTAPTVTSGTIDNGEYAIGFCGQQGTSTVTGDSDAANGSWSAAANIATAGSTANTNQTLTEQNKAVNASGTQTYNPTFSVSDVCAIGIIAVQEPASTTPVGRKLFVSQAVQRAAVR